jgi:hypothetical protein
MDTMEVLSSDTEERATVPINKNVNKNVSNSSTRPTVAASPTIATAAPTTTTAATTSSSATSTGNISTSTPTSKCANCHSGTKNGSCHFNLCQRCCSKIPAKCAVSTHNQRKPKSIEPTLVTAIAQCIQDQTALKFTYFSGSRIGVERSALVLRWCVATDDYFKNQKLPFITESSFRAQEGDETRTYVLDRILPNQWSVVADNPPSPTAIAAATTAPTISPNVTNGSASLTADVIDITDTASQKRPSNDADGALPTLPPKESEAQSTQ